MTIKTTINHIAIALFLIALSNLLFASDVVPRCYVQAMNGSDPMISENVDLSQYQPVDRRINVRFIEYADPAVEFLTDEQFWQDRLEVVNNIFSQAELNFVFEVFSQRELDIDEYANAFEDCNVPPIDETLAQGFENKLYVVSMRQWVNRLYIEGYDSNGDGDFDDPLDLEPWYRTERGCIDRIFGHVVYVGNMPGNNPSGREIAFYIAQALGLYETLENHFGSEEGDLLEDTDPDDESNLMYDSHLGGNSLTTNQSQRLHWALTTRPTLLPLIEIETYFANTIGGSSVYGTLLHYDEVDISSGSYVTLLEGNTYDIGTNEEIIIQGSTQYKHNRWNNNLNDYYLTRNKTINRTEPDYSSQKAKFKAINPVTIEYTPNLPGIVLDLQDPWWINDQTGEQPGDVWVAIENNTYDVFLNQNEQFDPELPIYSLRTPQYVGAMDGIYEFSNWSSGASTFGNSNNRTTNVVFLASNDTIVANYTKISNQPGLLALSTPITIPAGAYIEFHLEFNIIVNYLGEFNALGTEQQPITLTSDGTDNWPGIKVFNDGTIDLQNVTISNSTNGIIFAYDDNVTTNAKDKTVNNVNFDNNDNGLLVEGGIAPPLTGTSIITVSNCSFTGNDSGIKFKDATLPGSNVVPNVDAVVVNSAFEANNYGLYIEENAKNLTIKENTFSNNQTSVAVENVWSPSIQYHCDFWIIQNVFRNNYDGILVVDTGPSVQCIIRNNTFYSNEFSVFRSSDQLNVVCFVYNNIASNGAYGLLLPDQDRVEYNDVWQMSSGELWEPQGGTGNRNEDPQLKDPLNGDFTLLSSSPCIDIGDPDSPLDPDSTRADMGAFYYDAVPLAPVLSISGSMGDNPTLSWVDGGESDLDHFILRKTYTNDSGTMTLYININAGTNQYEDTGITIQKRGNTVAEYRVKSVDWIDQESSYSNQRSTFGLGPMWKEALPRYYALHDNYPNPFNPTTTIRYDLPEQSLVSLVIYDIMGREVRTLIDSREQSGFNSVVWNGRDNAGNSVSTGIYIYVLKAWSQESDKTYQKTEKTVLLR